MEEPGADPESSSSNLWVIGVIINVIGSLSINLSTNCIKLSHTRLAAIKRKDPDRPLPTFLKSPRQWFNVERNANRIWLGSMIVFVVANVANFASFAFAAQSLLAALGSIQFVSNVIFAKVVNKERLNPWILLGTVVVVIGCVLLVAFGSHESPSFTAEELMDLYSNPAYIAYLCAAGVLCVISYGIYQIGKRKVPHIAEKSAEEMGMWYRWLPILYMLFSASIGTQSVLYGKSMSLLLRTTLSGDNQVGQWYTWLVVVLFLGCAFFWVVRFNKGLKMFPVSIIMPTLQVGWILLSMISGSIYFREIQGMTTLEKVMFGVGTAILISGVYLITTSTNPTSNVPVQSKISIIGGGLYCLPMEGDENNHVLRRHTIHLLAECAQEEHSSSCCDKDKGIGGSCSRRHTSPNILQY